jgi:hypothetical protein
MVHYLGAVDLGFEYESFSIYQQMTLSTLGLLTAVVSSLLSTYAGALDRLRIYYASTGLRTSF